MPYFYFRETNLFSVFTLISKIVSSGNSDMTRPEETKTNLNSYIYVLYLSQGTECNTTKVSNILQFIPPAQVSDILLFNPRTFSKIE